MSIGNPRRILTLAVCALLSVFAISAPCLAQNAAGISAANEILDRIEDAFGKRDVALATQDLSDRFVAVAGAPGGAVVMDKATVTEQLKKLFAAGVNSLDQKFTNREVRLAGNGASVSVTTVIVDRMPDGKTKSSREFRFFVTEGGKWRLLFAAPAIGESEVFVVGVSPDGQAGKLGAAGGDALRSYAGQRIIGMEQFLGLTRYAVPASDGGTIPLVLERAGKEVPLSVKPGLLGVRIAEHLVPCADETYYPPDRPHPVKDAFMRQAEASAKGDFDAYVAGCTQVSLHLAMGAGGIRAIDPANRAKELTARYREGLKDMKVTGAECFDVSAIVKGDTAYVSGNALVRMNTGGFFLAERFRVFALQGGAWKLVADMARNGGSPTVGAPVKPSEHAVKTIAGGWTWSSNTTVKLIPDGFFQSSDGQTGRWMVLDDGARRFLLHWDAGRVDEMTVSEDGQMMTGKNKDGAAVWGRRVAKETEEGTGPAGAEQVLRPEEDARPRKRENRRRSGGDRVR